MHRLFTFIALCVLWIILSGQMDFFHISLGIISAGIITFISTGLLFDDDAPSVAGALKILCRMIPYLFWLLKEIMLANMHVLYLALVPSGIRHVQPAIIHFHTKLKDPAARYLLANSITLTPGTVTIKMEGSQLYVHSISDKTTVSLEGDMEKRIAHVFGEDIAEVKS